MFMVSRSFHLASQAAGRGTIGGRVAGLAAGRFSRITLAYGFFFPPFRFMSPL